MAHLHHVNPVLVDQLFQMDAELGDIGVLVEVGGVEGPMISQHYPLHIRVVSCLTEVLFQEGVLLGSWTVGMF